MTFASELQSAAALERHRPEGAYDQDCGCVSDSTTTDADVAATIQAVSLSAKPQPASAPAIACTLSAGSMKGRIADWHNLLAQHRSASPDA